MAKLKAPENAGFNANNYQFRFVPIGNIVIDPEISNIFVISEKVLNEIKTSIKKFGYDKSQPVVLWKNKNILLDGHTRYAAARAAGLDEIPAIEKEFDDREDAMFYTFERQAVRRNLINAEIMLAVSILEGGKNPNGAGRKARVLAEKLGVSAATVYQAKAVLKEADEDTVRAVKSGEKSIKRAYNDLESVSNSKKAREAVFQTNDAKSLPQNVSFLNAAVILLIEAGHKESANLLVNHFLKKNEKRGFYDLLPEAIREELPGLPLVNSVD